MKIKLSNPYVYKSIIIIFISFLIYSPAFLGDDMLAGMAMQLSFYYSPIIILIIGTIVFFKQLRKRSIVILLFLFLIAYLPYGTHYISHELKWFIHDNQSFSVEKLQEKFDDYNMDFSLLKYTVVNYEKGHLTINAEVNKQAANFNEIDKENQELFREKIIKDLVQFVVGNANFYELKSFTLQVKYFNTIYFFEEIPLKEENGRRYRIDDDDLYEKIEASIRERMTVIKKK